MLQKDRLFLKVNKTYSSTALYSLKLMDIPKFEKKAHMMWAFFYKCTLFNSNDFTKFIMVNDRNFWLRPCSISCTGKSK